MWKPNASRLSYNLVVILLLLSRMKSRSRYEANKVHSVVSEIVSSLGYILEMNSLNLLLLKEIRSSV